VLGVVSPCGPPSAFLLVVGASGFLHPWPSAPGRCAPSFRTVPSAGDSLGRPGPSDGLQGRHNKLINVINFSYIIFKLKKRPLNIKLVRKI